MTVAREDVASLPSDVFNVVEHNNYFTKEGINAKVIEANGDAPVIAALQSGSVQFVDVTSSALLAADASGADIQIVAAMSVAPGQLVMSGKLASSAGLTATSSQCAKVNALKGKTIGVADIGGGGEYQLIAILNGCNLPESSVRVVGIGSSSAEVTALDAGRVDAVIPTAPYGNKLVADSGDLMVGDIWGGSVANLKSTTFMVLAARKSYIQSNPEAVTRIQKAWSDALAYMHSNIGGTASIVQSGLGSSFDAATVKSAVGNGSGWMTSPMVSQADFKDIVSFAELSGLKQVSSVTYDQAVAQVAKGTG